MSGVLQIEDVRPTPMADELVFCNLPPRKSVSNCEEPSRLSYYNGNENLAVPFKWETSPGRPMIDSQPGSIPGSAATRARLRPPPAAAGTGWLHRSSSGEGGVEESNRRLSSTSVPASPATYQQRSRLPPKIRSFGRRDQYIPTSSSLNSSTMNSTPDYGADHRVNRSRDSMRLRSDFDRPEVSDDEGADEPRSGTAAAPSKGESSFSSSNFSSSIGSPSSANSGGSRGSSRELTVLRNLVNIASAPNAAASNCKYYGPAHSTSESFSEEGNGDSDVAPPRGFLSCMPIFSKVRMIQSQLGKNERQMPGGTINFSNRLTPGLKNKGNRLSL